MTKLQIKTLFLYEKFNNIGNVLDGRKEEKHYCIKFIFVYFNLILFFRYGGKIGKYLIYVLSNIT